VKIIIAPNAFKGSLTQQQAIQAIELGILDVTQNVTLIKMPVADGGDGLLNALESPLKANTISTQVKGALGNTIKTNFLYISNQQQAILELAQCCGLAQLKPADYNPLKTSTYGLGELIIKAIEEGAKNITIGIGGSSTNDGGMGMATALGIKFFNKHQRLLKGNGSNLLEVHSIDTAGANPLLKNINFNIISDVNNPLLGETGCAKVYAAQKGANEEMIQQLECGMTNFANRIEKELHINIKTIEGGGAAGGLGAGLIAFLNAKLLPGSETVLTLLAFDKKLKTADLVFTGEGKLDLQTTHGKIPAIIAEKAQQAQVPCIAIAGSITDNREHKYSATYSLKSDETSLAESMKNAFALLRKKTAIAMTNFLAND